MAYKLIALALETHHPAPRKVILCKYAERANPDGLNAWPSIETLARVAGVSERQAQRYVRELEAEGWLEQTAPAGRYKPATYRVHLTHAARVAAVARRADSTVVVMGDTDDTHESGGKGDTDDTHDSGARGDTGVGSWVTPSVTRSGSSNRSKRSGPENTPAPTPADSFAVILRLTHDAIGLVGAPCDELELVEAIKGRCAQLRIPYDGDGIRRALDAANFRRAQQGLRPTSDGNAGAAAARLAGLGKAATA